MIKINGKEMLIDNFYSGELHLRMKGRQVYDLSESEWVTITWKINPDKLSQEFEALGYYKRRLDDLRLRVPIFLHMKYIPHSRMDRDEGGKIFTLKYFAERLNFLNFDRVEVLDAHSQVSLALIDRVRECTHYDFFHWTIDSVFGNEDYQIIMPDLGAYKKYSKKYGRYGKAGYGIKVRDWATGKIESQELVFDTHKKSYIIIDDICSMGTTFMNVAALIKQQAPDSKIYLMVSHIEPGAALPQGVLNDPNIERVYSTDSIEHGIEHEKLTILK